MGWMKETFGFNPFSVVEDIFGGIGDIVEGVFDAVGDVMEGIGDFVTKVLEDPLPVILQIGGAMIGIPPYVTAAVLTAARGGDIGDIAKSALISYASTEFLSSTQIGADVQNYTSNLVAGDVTDFLIKDLGLPVEHATAVWKATSASLNGAVLGGFRAVLSGQDVSDSMLSGFTSGLVYSSTDSFFAEMNKDPNWGLSAKSLDLLKGVTSTALNTIVSGKGDPSAAVANYVAYATLQMGASEIYKAATSAYEDLTGKTALAEAAQDEYVKVKSEYDVEAQRFNAEIKISNDAQESYASIYKGEYSRIEGMLNVYKNAFDSAKVGYDKEMDRYNTSKEIAENYDAKMQEKGYSLWQASEDSPLIYTKFRADGQMEIGFGKEWYITDANAAASQLKILAPNLRSYSDTYKEILDSENTADVTKRLNEQKAIVEVSSAKIATIKANIENPASGNLAERLKAAADKYQKEYTSYASSQAAADRAAKNYSSIVSEIATRDMTIDSLNTGAIKVTGMSDGTYTLDNGMTMKDGKFYQAGTQLYGNAAGVSQSGMEFTDNSGNVVRFGSDVGRQLSSTDAKQIFARDYGLTLTDDEAKKFVGGSYVNFDITKFQDLAIDKIDAEFRALAGRDATAAEAKTFMNQDDAITAAQNAALDDMNLPTGIIPATATQAEKVTFGKAYAAARATLGAGKTFEWTDDKGVTGTYITDNREEAGFRKAVFQATGDFASGDTNIIKARLGEAIRMSNTTNKYTDMNPADLSAGDMNRFVDNYAKATPEQRVSLLRGVDSATYNVISEMYKSHAGDSARPALTSFAPAYDVGTLKASDMTNYTGVLKTGLQGAAADINGLIIRGGQVIANIVGLDTPMMDKMQEILSEGKETRMNKLVGHERSVAGGIASGVSSAITWSLGPVGMLATLGGIAANNAWIEGSSAVIGADGRSFANAKEAQDNGVWTYRKLTDAENGMRTAVMASLEIVGEFAGIPGMKLLMKGIPITGNVGQIINSVKNFGLGMGNEQVSELLTTTAQMAVDKWAKFGLGQAATFDDYKNALIDTAVATTAAVGTAGSMATATTNMRNAANARAVFSEDTREGVNPTLPSLVQVYKDAGIQQYDVDQIVKAVQNTIKTGGEGIDALRDRTTTRLIDLGVSGIRAENMASEMVDRVYTDSITASLTAANFTPEQIGTLLDPIKNDLINQVGTDAFHTNLRDAASSTGTSAAAVDALLYGFTGVQPKVVTATKTTTADTSTAAAEGTNAGLTTEKVAEIIGGVAAINPGLTIEQVTKIVNDTISTMPAGITPSQVELAVQMATSGFTTKADLDAAVAGITIPAGVTKEDVSAAIKTYMEANPGMTAADVGSALDTYFASNPAVTTAGVNTAITTAMKDVATKTDIDTAISNITFPAGISKDDVAAAIKTYMTDNPGLSATDVATAISTYMAANPGLTSTDLDAAISTATKDIATKADIDTAISNIVFPAGISKEDVTASIKAYMEANPGISATDVATAISTYMTANPGLTKADMDTAVTEATKNLATTTSVDTITKALETLGADVQTAFDGLTAAQKAEVEARVQQGENLETAIGTVATSVATLAKDTTTALETINKTITTLSTETQTAFENMSAAQKAEVASRIEMGQNLETAIGTVQENLTKTNLAIATQITTLGEKTQAQYEGLTANQKAEVAARIQMGENLETAIGDVASTLSTEITAVKDSIEAEKQRQIAISKAAASAAKGKELSSLSNKLISPNTGDGAPVTPGFKAPFMSSPDKGSAFKGPLDEFLKMVETGSYVKPQPTTGVPMPQQQQQPVQTAAPSTPESSYFSYGTANEIDSILGQSKVASGDFAPYEMTSKSGGLADGTRHGRFAGGGLNTVNFAGKDRVDFRSGAAVSGPGDGQSDDIPAMLADGEFVFPADVVSALGNGSTKAGSDKLYDMMHSIRSHHRSASPKDLPPVAKMSPLDYLRDVKSGKRR